MGPTIAAAGLRREIERLVELQPPAAEIENSGIDADAARSSAGTDLVAVVKRPGGPDDVDGLQPQRLARQSRSLVVVGLQRHPALLGDDRAVLPGGIVGDPCDVGDHVGTPS